MPTLTTTEHGEIRVHHHQVTRMADRLWRLRSPERRTATWKRPVSGSPRGQRVTLMRPSCSRPVTRKRHRKAGLFYTARTNNAVSTLANAHSFSRFSRK